MNLEKARESREKVPQTLNAKPENYLENYVDTKSLDYNKEIEKIVERIKETKETIYPDFKSDISPED